MLLLWNDVAMKLLGAVPFWCLQRQQSVREGVQRVCAYQSKRANIALCEGARETGAAVYTEGCPKKLAPVPPPQCWGFG
jgi:hypothetical protein